MTITRNLQALQTMVRRRLGWGSSDTFVSDAELRDMIHDSYGELYDLLITVHQNNFKTDTATLDTTADQGDYNLTSTKVIDAYKLVRVSVDFDNISIPMRRLNPESEVMSSASYAWNSGTDIKYHFVRYGRPGSEITFHPIPDGVYTVKIISIQDPPTLSLSTHINELGHDEYIVLDVMIKCLQMEEADTSLVERQKARYRERIENLAPPIDASNPETIRDDRSADEYRNDADTYRRGW